MLPGAARARRPSHSDAVTASGSPTSDALTDEQRRAGGIMTGRIEGRGEVVVLDVGADPGHARGSEAERAQAAPLSASTAALSISNQRSRVSGEAQCPSVVPRADQHDLVDAAPDGVRHLGVDDPCPQSQVADAAGRAGQAPSRSTSW